MNYTFTPNHKASFTHTAKSMLELRVNAVADNFPLTREQTIEVATPVQARECLKILAPLDTDRMSRTHVLHCIVPAVDGVARAVLLHLAFAHSVYALWNDQEYDHRAKRNFQAYCNTRPFNKNLLLDLAVLPTGARQRMVDWLNLVTHEQRIHDAAYKLIEVFINEYCENTGMLLERWPGLRVVFNRMPEPWPDRVGSIGSRRAAPAHWRWEAPLAWEWYVENGKRMEGVDVVLAGVSMMNNAPKQTPPPVSGTIVAWDRRAQ